MSENDKKYLNWKNVDRFSGRYFAPRPEQVGAGANVKKDFISGFLGNRVPAAGPDVVFVDIQSSWQKLVGPLAKHSMPVKLQGRNLHVRVENPAVTMDLKLQERHILERINKIAPNVVQKLYIKVGSINWQAPGENVRKLENSGKSREPTDKKKEGGQAPIELSAGSLELLEGLRNMKSSDK